MGGGDCHWKYMEEIITIGDYVPPANNRMRKIFKERN